MKPEILPTDNDWLHDQSKIPSVTWEAQNPQPFSTSEVVNLSSQEWVVSPTQVVSKEGHTTFSSREGALVQFKVGDGIFEPLYESIAYEFSSLVGSLSTPPTTAAFTLTADGTLVLGTISYMLFTLTLGCLDEKQREIFFSRCEPAALIGESILAVRLRNFDFGNGKFDSIAVGKSSNGGINALSYYIFDHSHILWGPREERVEMDLKKHRIEDNFWYLPYLSLKPEEFLALSTPFIQKLIDISDSAIKDICDRSSRKLVNVDVVNADSFIRMGQKISNFLINAREDFIREMDVYLQGVRTRTKFRLV